MLNGSFNERFNEALDITGAVKRRTREKLHQNLGLESIQQQ